MNKELEKIKSVYGEQFAHMCRSLFPTILEKEGVLFKILTSKFAPSRSLYFDIINNEQKEAFCDYIFQTYETTNKEEKSFISVSKTAEELMNEAGYILYPECKTESDIQVFRKYYNYDEKLCTFRNHRLETARVWFAVKKNVDEIVREDFKYPERQDEYGTSVISIQFTGGYNNYLSIKNRYNHTVVNPDATFDNNLDNIIPGLTNAFIKDFNIRYMNSQNTKFLLPNYVQGNDGKLYRFNINQNGIYYCENNVIVNDVAGRVQQLDSCRYLLIDDYVLDLKNKKILSQDEKDSFVESIGKIKKIEILKKNNKQKILTITPKRGKNIFISLDSKNNITGYKNYNIVKIGNYFMSKNHELQEIDVPNVRKVGISFLLSNKKLQSLNMPKLVSVNNMFLSTNKILSQIYLPQLKICGNLFLTNNENLTNIDLPNLELAGKYFITENRLVESIDLPKLRAVGNNFLKNCCNVTKKNLPKLKANENVFLKNNELISSQNAKTISNNGRSQ